MDTCSCDASEVVPSRTQLLERPGWHASGYEGSERQAWDEVADTVANDCDVCCSKPSWAASLSPPPVNMVTIYLETGVLKQEIETMLEQVPPNPSTYILHPLLHPLLHPHTPTSAPAPAP
eukprot:scaffold55114_cov56-Phaeocystis_antarctica.AAC.3